MIYIIDRIEDNIVVLENRETKEIININKEYLPKRIKEGNILIYTNNEFKKSRKIENERKKEILEKFKRLRKD